MNVLSERAKIVKQRNKNRVIVKILKMMEQGGVSLSDLEETHLPKDKDLINTHRGVMVHKEKARRSLEKARLAKKVKEDINE